MQKAPLQLYASALVFSPRKSQIREENFAHHPTWFKYGPDVEDHWGPALQTLESDFKVDLLTLSYDGKYLASAGLRTATISLWNTVTGTLHSKLEGHREGLRSIIFSRNGQLASISQSGEIRVWDPVTGASCHKVDAGFEISRSVIGEWPPAFAPDGTLAFSSQDWPGDTQVWTWIPNAGVLSVQMKIQSIVRGLAFLSNGDLALALSFDTRQASATTAPLKGEILIYNFENQAQRRISCARFSRASFSSSDQVVLALEDVHAKLVVYNLATGSCLSYDEYSIVLNYKYGITPNNLSFSGNRYIIYADDDGLVCYLDLQSRTNTIIGIWPGGISKTVTSSDSKLAFIGYCSKEIRLWDVASRSALRKDERAIVGASDRLNVPWNPSTRASSSRLNDDTYGFAAMVFSHDGRCFASVSFTGAIKIWDTTTWNEVRTVRETGQDFETVIFSTSGKYLAFGGRSTVEVWDPASGGLLIAFDQGDGDGREITAVMFSPNDEILVSGSSDGTVNFWDLKKWGLQRTLRLGNTLESMSFSKNGRRIACLTRHHNLVIQIWDAERYTCLQKISTNLQQSYIVNNISMSFSADESYIDTDLGRVQLQPSLNRLPSEVYTPDKRWHVDHDWLDYDGQKRVWLPSDYRPTCIARYDNILVMCHESGNLSYFEGNTQGSISAQAHETSIFETSKQSISEGTTYSSTSDQAHETTNLESDEMSFCEGSTHDSTLAQEHEATTHKNTKKRKGRACDSLHHWPKDKGKSKQ